METLRNFGTTAPGVLALAAFAAFAAFAALACSDQGDVTEPPPGSGGAGGLAGSGSGGSVATGGSSGVVAGAGGSGGRPASGEAGAGGAGAVASGSSGSGGETRSTGCDGTTAPESGRFSIDVGGATREYILAVPDDYDPSHAYRLIFAWHPRGGSAEQVATGFGGGYYGLQGRADGSAIFVSPEGLEQGWENKDGRDIAFLRAMLDRLRGELCIDQSRIFSTGFSYGGMMSYAIGCAMGDVFRAIAPMSGALYSGCEDGDSPVAMWGAHGDVDSVVPVENGRTARDVFIERNHCDPQTTPTEPSPCVSYDGCDAGYPVVWCEFSGDHTMPSNFGESIWSFFSQF
ncbi:prolyl oligopeptidase family serine peptidase [Sorangium sp. So ce291]|uniref:alpha/beta hydrolase family esterase n=1 Tax=Sorangium sp. So ce291 TaxID=3133294 RepID=UPI003F5EE226